MCAYYLNGKAKKKSGHNFDNQIKQMGKSIHYQQNHWTVKNQQKDFAISHSSITQDTTTMHFKNTYTILRCYHLLQEKSLHTHKDSILHSYIIVGKHQQGK